MIRGKLMLGLSALAVVGYGSEADARRDDLVMNRYMAVFKGESLPADVAERVAKAGGRLSLRIDGIGVVTATGDAGFVSKLEKDPDVLAVGPEFFDELPATSEMELNEAEGTGVAEEGAAVESASYLAPTPADNLYFYLWDIRRIGAPAAWARIPAAVQRQVTVAVLDTGVMDDHPDLIGQVVDRVATNYCQEKGGAFASASYPIYKTFINLVANPDWEPADGCSVAPSVAYHNHGTHVAGTVAAKVGGGRVVGVAPGVGIAAYKVFDRYRTTNAAGGVVDSVGAFSGPLLAAIVDAADKGHDVISMSLGGAYDRSIKSHNASWLARDRVAKYAHRKGSILVASSGNSAEGSNGTVAHLPSDLPTVISTSASNSDNIQFNAAGLYTAAPGSDTFASYSNYGASTDIAAPGGDCGPDGCLAKYFILSTIISNTGAPGYGFLAGTSMATPHVSAVAALVRAQHPEWTPGQVRAHLQATSDDVGYRQYFGHGILNADAATR